MCLLIHAEASLSLTGAREKAGCLLIHAEASLSHGGQGESPVHLYTRRSVSLALSESHRALPFNVAAAGSLLFPVRSWQRPCRGCPTSLTPGARGSYNMCATRETEGSAPTRSVTPSWSRAGFRHVCSRSSGRPCCRRWGCAIRRSLCSNPSNDAVGTS